MPDDSLILAGGFTPLSRAAAPVTGNTLMPIVTDNLQLIGSRTGMHLFPQ